MLQGLSASIIIRIYSTNVSLMPHHEHKKWLISYGLDFCLFLLQVLEKFTSRLVQSRVMAHKDLRTLSKYQLILARDQFRKNPPQHIKAQTTTHLFFANSSGSLLLWYVKRFYWLHQVFTVKPLEACSLLSCTDWYFRTAVFLMQCFCFCYNSTYLYLG